MNPCADVVVIVTSSVLAVLVELGVRTMLWIVADDPPAGENVYEFCDGVLG